MPAAAPLAPAGSQSRAELAPPTLFVSHGSPMLSVEPGRTGAMMTALAARLPTPRAVLVVSPHWSTTQAQVSRAPHQHAVHDFGGFPPALYELEYNAPGAPQLAARVAELLQAADIPVSQTDAGGLDHGAWVILRYLFADARVPVTQLSLQRQQGPAYQYRVGQALRALQAEGVLLIGSGSFTHNLREIRFGSATQEAPVEPYVSAFAHWMCDKLAAHDLDALLDYRRQAPFAERAHPSDEHLLPLFIALGAADDWHAQHHFDTGTTYGVLRMDAFAFGQAARAAALIS